MTDLERKIRDFFRRPRLAGLATITADIKPWVRYVTVTMGGDFHFLFCTDINSRKAEQIRQNPEVHLACGEFDPPDHSTYLQIMGRATILTDPEITSASWQDEWLRYFTGSDDPNYVMVRVEPYRVEYNSPQSPESEIWEK
jgi:general stress protein 26